MLEHGSPGVRAHLDGCPACREEHESHRALVRAEQTHNGK